jgi:hypothetical protein
MRPVSRVLPRPLATDVLDESSEDEFESEFESDFGAQHTATISNKSNIPAITTTGFICFILFKFN